MTKLETERVSAVNVRLVSCLRMAKSLLLNLRDMGMELDAAYDKIPLADDDAFEAWIVANFDLRADDAYDFIDFAALPAVVAARLKPTEAFSLADAMELLHVLTHLDDIVVEQDGDATPS